MLVKPNMGLVVWDSINDYFSHVQLKSNFEALDAHDHTVGKGKQIPYGGLAEQSVGPENLREDIGVTELGIWHTIAQSPLADFGGKTVNSGNLYFFTSSSLVATANTVAPVTFYLNPSDFTLTGKTPKVRLQMFAITGSTSPSTVTLTGGLYPVIGTSGAASSSTFNPTTTANLTSLEVEEKIIVSSSAFAVPGPGFYTFGVKVGSITVPTGIWAGVRLQYHYV